jgi:hypothetical protein
MNFDTTLKLKRGPDETGDWKVARTRRLESLRYMSQLQNSGMYEDF